MKNQKSKGKIQINRKTKFSELIKKFPEAVETLMEEGLYCIGCPMSSAETLEQGCQAHGINPDKLIKKINKKLEEKRA